MPLARVHRPGWFWIFPRVLLVTFILTLFSFAVSLFLGIIGVAAVSKMRGVHPHMTFAYRHIALPAAITAGGIVLICTAVLEIRHYSQARALAEIENASGHARA